ncbi:MAG: TAXI family TRAP transporter solute-binding subunit [Alphaproteobacteria bacterium]
MSFRRRLSGPRRAAAWLALAAALVIGASSQAQEAPNSYVIGSAQHGGLYRPLASSICQLLNKGTAEHGYRCRAIRSAGAVENIISLAEGSAAFGLVQSDVERQATAGIGEFAGSQPFEALRSVLAAHGEPLTILVPADSEIHAFDDLPGHRVGIGPPGSGGRAMFNETMAAAGWTPAGFAALAELSYDELVAALCAGEIDAAAITVGHPNSYTQRAILDCDARILPLAGPTVERVLGKIASYRVLEIPGGLYANHATSITSFGPVALLMTRADVADAAVEAITAAVLDQIETLQQLSPAFQHLDAAAMYPAEASTPIHPGAARAFAARGLGPPQ